MTQQQPKKVMATAELFADSAGAIHTKGELYEGVDARAFLLLIHDMLRVVEEKGYITENVVKAKRAVFEQLASWGMSPSETIPPVADQKRRQRLAENGHAG